MERYGTRTTFSFGEFTLEFNATKYSNCDVHTNDFGAVAIAMHFYKGDTLDTTLWEDVFVGVDPKLNEKGYAFQGERDYYEFHELKGIYYVIVGYVSIGSYTIYETYASELEWSRLLAKLQLRE